MAVLRDILLSWNGQARAIVNSQGYPIEHNCLKLTNLCLEINYESRVHKANSVSDKTLAVNLPGFFRVQ